MINFVTKKDGTKVPFDGEKIKAAVTAAAMQAGVSADDASNTAQKVLDSVSAAFVDKDEVATTEIKEKVLADLDASAPAVSAAWRKHDETMAK